MLLLSSVVGELPGRWGSVAIAQEAGKRDKPLINFRSPPREYQEFKTGGWDVKIEKQMLVEDQALAQRAFTRLEQKLAFLLTILPKHSHAELQQVPIYLMFGSRAAGGGDDSGANYVPKNGPDFHPDLDPRWRNSVVVKSAQNYVGLSEFWSIKVLLHELGHAWHLIHWPERHPEILAAWQNATDRGSYQNVTDVIEGKHFDRAYALTNQLEYFAELTCMYFVGCNYPPLNRRELQVYDPTGYAMIEKMWDVERDRAKSVAAPKNPKPDTARAKPKPPKPSVTPGSTGVAAPPPPKEYRTWTDTLDNSELEAQFAGLAGGNARLRKKDGTVVTVPVERLSKDDQDWIRDRRR